MVWLVGETVVVGAGVEADGVAVVGETIVVVGAGVEVDGVAVVGKAVVVVGAGVEADGVAVVGETVVVVGAGVEVDGVAVVGETVVARNRQPDRDTHINSKSMCWHILLVPLSEIELVSMSKTVMFCAASIRTLATCSQDGFVVNLASMMLMIDPFLEKK